MAWCLQCWMQSQKTVTATKVLDEEDLCDLHYRQALGPGLPAMPKTAAPPPAAAPILTQTAGKPRTQETKMNKERRCICKPDCTEIAKSNSSPYAKGHNPNMQKKAKPAAGREKKSSQKNRGGQNGNTAATINVALEQKHLDAIWAGLSLEQKAAKLFAAE